MSKGRCGLHVQKDRMDSMIQVSDLSHMNAFAPSAFSRDDPGFIILPSILRKHQLHGLFADMHDSIRSIYLGSR